MTKGLKEVLRKENEVIEVCNVDTKSKSKDFAKSDKLFYIMTHGTIQTGKAVVLLMKKEV